MELLTGDRWMPVSDSFPDQSNPLSGASEGFEWAYDHGQHMVAVPTPTSHVNNAIAEKAPPQKLQPVRFSGRAFPDIQDHSQMPSAGHLLEVLPELGLEAIKVDDAVDIDGLTREESALGLSNMVLSSGRRGSDWGDISLSSSLNCVDELSAGARARRKRKRSRRKPKGKLEGYLEKLVARINDRQEQMHKQLIEMMEKKERERILREEAWKHQEFERIKIDEEARNQEMSRTIAFTSFIQSLLGRIIEIPNPLDELRDQNKIGNGREVQFKKDVTGGNDC